MITINLHNDGKDKPQSYEATLNEDYSNVYLNGYGMNKEQAIAELKKRANEKIAELENVEYHIVQLVDCLGQNI